MQTYIRLCTRVVGLALLVHSLCAEPYLTQVFKDKALQSKTISIRSKPANITDVIELIGVSAGIDFLIDPKVQGQTGKLYFEQRSAGDVLQVVLTKNRPRLALVKEHGVWRILLHDDAVALLKHAHREPVVTHYFVLHHVKCDEQLRNRIEQMWQKITAQHNLSNGYCSVECDSKKVFVRGYKKHVAELGQFVKHIDCSVARVRIDAIVAEVDNKYEQQLGFNWSKLSQPGTSEEVSFASPAAQLVHKKGAVHIPFLIGGTDLNLPQILVELHAAETQSKARILLKPSVLTNNGEMAEILIGCSVPIRTMVEDFIHGKSRNVQTVQYKDVGTILNVRPTVSTDRQSVQLDIWVENSSVISPPSDAAPTIKTIRTRNKVTLKQGQSTAISGLMLKKDQTGSNKISGLAQIPIFGFPFRADEKAHQESQMIIFLTTEVV